MIVRFSRKTEQSSEGTSVPGEGVLLPVQRPRLKPVLRSVAAVTLAAFTITSIVPSVFAQTVHSKETLRTLESAENSKATTGLEERLREENPAGLSRRGFLATAGLAVGGAALTSLTPAPVVAQQPPVPAASNLPQGFPSRILLTEPLTGDPTLGGVIAQQPIPFPEMTIHVPVAQSARAIGTKNKVLDGTQLPMRFLQPHGRTVSAPDDTNAGVARVKVTSTPDSFKVEGTMPQRTTTIAPPTLFKPELKTAVFDLLVRLFGTAWRWGRNSLSAPAQWQGFSIQAEETDYTLWDPWVLSLYSDSDVNRLFEGMAQTAKQTGGQARVLYGTEGALRWEGYADLPGPSAAAGEVVKHLYAAQKAGIKISPLMGAPSWASLNGWDDGLQYVELMSSSYPTFDWDRAYLDIETWTTVEWATAREKNDRAALQRLAWRWYQFHLEVLDRVHAEPVHLYTFIPTADAFFAEVLAEALEAHKASWDDRIVPVAMAYTDLDKAPGTIARVSEALGVTVEATAFELKPDGFNKRETLFDEFSADPRKAEQEMQTAITAAGAKTVVIDTASTLALMTLGTQAHVAQSDLLWGDRSFQLATLDLLKTGRFLVGEDQELPIRERARIPVAESTGEQLVRTRDSFLQGLETGPLGAAAPYRMFQMMRGIAQGNPAFQVDAVPARTESIWLRPVRFIQGQISRIGQPEVVSVDMLTGDGRDASSMISNVMGTNAGLFGVPPGKITLRVKIKRDPKLPKWQSVDLNVYTRVGLSYWGSGSEMQQEFEGVARIPPGEEYGYADIVMDVPPSGILFYNIKLMDQEKRVVEWVGAGQDPVLLGEGWPTLAEEMLGQNGRFETQLKELAIVPDPVNQDRPDLRIAAETARVNAMGIIGGTHFPKIVRMQPEELEDAKAFDEALRVMRASGVNAISIPIPEMADFVRQTLILMQMIPGRQQVLISQLAQQKIRTMIEQIQQAVSLANRYGIQAHIEVSMADLEAIEASKEIRDLEKASARFGRETSGLAQALSLLTEINDRTGLGLTGVLIYDPEGKTSQAWPQASRFPHLPTVRDWLENEIVDRIDSPLIIVGPAPDDAHPNRVSNEKSLYAVAVPLYSGKGDKADPAVVLNRVRELDDKQGPETLPVSQPGSKAVFLDAASLSRSSAWLGGLPTVGQDASVRKALNARVRVPTTDLLLQQGLPEADVDAAKTYALTVTQEKLTADLNTPFIGAGDQRSANPEHSLARAVVGAWAHEVNRIQSLQGQPRFSTAAENFIISAVAKIRALPLIYAGHGYAEVELAGPTSMSMSAAYPVPLIVNLTHHGTQEYGYYKVTLTGFSHATRRPVKHTFYTLLKKDVTTRVAIPLEGIPQGLFTYRIDAQPTSLGRRFGRMVSSLDTLERNGAIAGGDVWVGDQDKIGSDPRPTVEDWLAFDQTVFDEHQTWLDLLEMLTTGKTEEQVREAFVPDPQREANRFGLWQERDAGGTVTRVLNPGVVLPAELERLEDLQAGNVAAVRAAPPEARPFIDLTPRAEPTLAEKLVFNSARALAVLIASAAGIAAVATLLQSLAGWLQMIFVQPFSRRSLILPGSTTPPSAPPVIPPVPSTPPASGGTTNTAAGAEEHLRTQQTSIHDQVVTSSGGGSFFTALMRSMRGIEVDSSAHEIDRYRAVAAAGSSFATLTPEVARSTMTIRPGDAPERLPANDREVLAEFAQEQIGKSLSRGNRATPGILTAQIRVGTTFTSGNQTWISALQQTIQQLDPSASLAGLNATTPGWVTVTIHLPRDGRVTPEYMAGIKQLRRQIGQAFVRQVDGYPELDTREFHLADSSPTGIAAFFQRIYVDSAKREIPGRDQGRWINQDVSAEMYGPVNKELPQGIVAPPIHLDWRPWTVIGNAYKYEKGGLWANIKRYGAALIPLFFLRLGLEDRDRVAMRKESWSPLLPVVTWGMWGALAIPFLIFGAVSLPVVLPLAVGVLVARVASIVLTNLKTDPNSTKPPDMTGWDLQILLIAGVFAAAVYFLVVPAVVTAVGLAIPSLGAIFLNAIAAAGAATGILSILSVFASTVVSGIVASPAFWAVAAILGGRATLTILFYAIELVQTAVVIPVGFVSAVLRSLGREEARGNRAWNFAIFFTDVTKKIVSDLLVPLVVFVQVLGYESSMTMRKLQDSIARRANVMHPTAFGLGILVAVIVGLLLMPQAWIPTAIGGFLVLLNTVGNFIFAGLDRDWGRVFNFRWMVGVAVGALLLTPLFAPAIAAWITAHAGMIILGTFGVVHLLPAVGMWLVVSLASIGSFGEIASNRRHNFLNNTLLGRAIQVVDNQFSRFHGLTDVLFVMRDSAGIPMTLSEPENYQLNAWDQVGRWYAGDVFVKMFQWAGYRIGVPMRDWANLNLAKREEFGDLVERHLLSTDHSMVSAGIWRLLEDAMVEKWTGMTASPVITGIRDLKPGDDKDLINQLDFDIASTLNGANGRFATYLEGTIPGIVLPFTVEAYNADANGVVRIGLRPKIWSGRFVMEGNPAFLAKGQKLAALRSWMYGEADLDLGIQVTAQGLSAGVPESDRQYRFYSQEEAGVQHQINQGLESLRAYEGGIGALHMEALAPGYARGHDPLARQSLSEKFWAGWTSSMAAFVPSGNQAPGAPIAGAPFGRIFRVSNMMLLNTREGDIRPGDITDTQLGNPDPRAIIRGLAQIPPGSSAGQEEGAARSDASVAQDAIHYAGREVRRLLSGTDAHPVAKAFLHITGKRTANPQTELIHTAPFTEVAKTWIDKLRVPYRASKTWGSSVKEFLQRPARLDQSATIQTLLGMSDAELGEILVRRWADDWQAGRTALSLQNYIRSLSPLQPDTDTVAEMMTDRNSNMGAKWGEQIANLHQQTQSNNPEITRWAQQRHDLTVRDGRAQPGSPSDEEIRETRAAMRATRGLSSEFRKGRLHLYDTGSLFHRVTTGLINGAVIGVVAGLLWATPVVAVAMGVTAAVLTVLMTTASRDTRGLTSGILAAVGAFAAIWKFGAFASYAPTAVGLGIMIPIVGWALLAGFVGYLLFMAPDLAGFATMARWTGAIKSSLGFGLLFGLPLLFYFGPVVAWAILFGMVVGLWMAYSNQLIPGLWAISARGLNFLGIGGLSGGAVTVVMQSLGIAGAISTGWMVFAAVATIALVFHFLPPPYSRDVRILARLYGRNPDHFAGFWDRSSWRLSAGLPFMEGLQYFRIPLFIWGGSLPSEALAISMLEAQIILNAREQVAPISAFNLLLWRRAYAIMEQVTKAEDTLGGYSGVADLDDGSRRGASGTGSPLPPAAFVARQQMIHLAGEMSQIDKALNRAAEDGVGAEMHEIIPMIFSQSPLFTGDRSSHAGVISRQNGAEQQVIIEQIGIGASTNPATREKQDRISLRIGDQRIELDVDHDGFVSTQGQYYGALLSTSYHLMTHLWGTRAFEMLQMGHTSLANGPSNLDNLLFAWTFGDRDMARVGGTFLPGWFENAYETALPFVEPEFSPRAQRAMRWDLQEKTRLLAARMAGGDIQRALALERDLSSRPDSALEAMFSSINPRTKDPAELLQYQVLPKIIQLRHTLAAWNREVDPVLRQLPVSRASMIGNATGVDHFAVLADAMGTVRSSRAGAEERTVAEPQFVMPVAGMDQWSPTVSITSVDATVTTATVTAGPVSPVTTTITTSVGEGRGLFRTMETLPELRVAVISAETALNYPELSGITGKLKQIGNAYLLVLPNDPDQLAEAVMPLMDRTMSVQLYGVTGADRSLQIFKGTLSEYNTVAVTPVGNSRAFREILGQIMAALAGVPAESVTASELDQVEQAVFGTLLSA